MRQSRAWHPSVLDLGHQLVEFSLARRRCLFLQGSMEEIECGTAGCARVFACCACFFWGGLPWRERSVEGEGNISRDKMAKGTRGGVRGHLICHRNIQTQWIRTDLAAPPVQHSDEMAHAPSSPSSPSSPCRISRRSLHIDSFQASR